MLGHSNDKSTIQNTFRYNNQVLHHPKDIANGFCDYFANVGPQFAKMIPTSKYDHNHYLTSQNYPNPSSIFISPTDPSEINKIISGLKSKKSCGHDNLSTSFLKQIALEIAAHISILVNKSLEHGIVPDMHKIAKVIPIYKSKEKDVFSNYRPISLLPSI